MNDYRYKAAAGLTCLLLMFLTPGSGLADGLYPDFASGAARKRIAVGTVAAGYAATGVWTYLAWYKDAPRHPFTIENDGWFGHDTYAGGADKLGHAFGSNLLMQGTAGVLDGQGFTRGESTAWSALLTMAFFGMIEIKDGYHTSFSPGDLAFDAAGVLWGAAYRHWPWLAERVAFQMQYFPSRDYRRQGKISYNIAEDYSGQIFALAFHLAALPSPGPLRWLDLTAGYAATGYLPKPAGRTAPREQTVLLGVGLNLAELNAAFESDSAWPPVRSAVRFLATHVRVPGTTAWAAAN